MHPRLSLHLHPGVFHILFFVLSIPHLLESTFTHCSTPCVHTHGHRRPRPTLPHPNSSCSHHLVFLSPRLRLRLMGHAPHHLPLLASPLAPRSLSPAPAALSPGSSIHPRPQPYHPAHPSTRARHSRTSVAAAARWPTPRISLYMGFGESLHDSRLGRFSPSLQPPRVSHDPSNRPPPLSKGAHSPV